MSILDAIELTARPQPLWPLFMNVRDWQTMLAAGYGEQSVLDDGTVERRIGGRPVVLYPTTVPR